MRAYTVYLADIADALGKIQEFTAGMAYDEFLHDDKTQSTVIRKFEIPGEAANRSRCPSGRSILPSPGARWQGCGTG